MIDIHNHILPGVDDGAIDIKQALIMIKKQISDGVHSLILTPHVQSRVQKIASEKHLNIFKTLKKEVKTKKLEIELYLGAEILYRSHLDPNYEEITLCNSKYILIEFSTRHKTPVEDIVYDLSAQGFIPIIAHIERYDYLEFSDYYQIKASGGLIQVNAKTIINKRANKKTKQKLKRLLKEELIDFIATDAHDMSDRAPNLKEAYDFLSKQVRPKYLKELFETNALKIIDYK